MRGRHDPQVTMLALVDLEERVPKDHPLRTIKAVADEALEHQSAEFDRMYSKVGRASVPRETCTFLPGSRKLAAMRIGQAYHGSYCQPSMILSQKVCAGRSRTNLPTPGYNIQSLFRILPQHTVALRGAKSLELPQNGFLRGNHA